MAIGERIGFATDGAVSSKSKPNMGLKTSDAGQAKFRINQSNPLEPGG